MVCSYFSEFPLLKPRSKTPALALPYSAGKAEVKKSEFLITFVLIALTGPPVVPTVEKWFGFGIFNPSMRHKTPVGEFPRITMSFLESSGELTPAKLAARREGSERPPA